MKRQKNANRVVDASAIRAALDCPVGRSALNSFTKLIGAWLTEHLDPAAHHWLVETEDGQKELEEIWPEIVEAYFKALSRTASNKNRRSGSVRQRRAVRHTIGHYNHFLEIDERSREARIFRIDVLGSRTLFTSAPIPSTKGWTKAVATFAGKLGEDLLMDSPVARRLLGL